MQNALGQPAAIGVERQEEKAKRHSAKERMNRHKCIIYAKGEREIDRKGPLLT